MITRSLTSLAILLAAPMALAQTVPAELPTPGHAQPGPVRMKMPKPITTGESACLPMSLRGVQPVIKARVGERELTLIFDTGAPGGPHMTEEMLLSLGAEKVGEVRISDPSLRNPMPAGLFKLGKMALGDVVIADWLAVGRDEINRGPAHDGVIGLGAFDGYVVTLDYPGGSLTITKGRLPEADGKTRFQYDGPIPTVPLTLDGQSIAAHIDTGNGRYPIILPASVAESLPRKEEAFAVGIARTVNNSFSLKAVPVSESKVGDVPLYAGTAAYPAPAREANIGSALLRDFVLRIDPANGIVELTHVGEATDGCAIV